jgi:uncharacterized phage-associated protein
VADTAHAPQDPRGIANRIWDIARQRGKSLTPMQLTKLVYVAHGWSLAILNRPLSIAPVQAWQYGPVYPEVYSAFKRFGSGSVTSPAVSRATGVEFKATLDAEDIGLLNAVVDGYGDIHAFQLSNMMHQSGTPWTETYDKNGAYSVIPDDLIKRHYDGLLAARSAQNA